MHYQRQVFFRPAEIRRESITVRPDLYNATRRLLGRSPKDCVFVPIRSMQILAVIGEDEIIFVDSMSYAVRDGEGGRVIVLAWQKPNGYTRQSLVDPVSIEVVHYDDRQNDLQLRLVGDFFAAMNELLERMQEEMPRNVAQVIAIKE